jgi:hypothetical protein
MSKRPFTIAHESGLERSGRWLAPTAGRARLAAWDSSAGDERRSGRSTSGSATSGSTASVPATSPLSRSRSWRQAPLPRWGRTARRTSHRPYTS